MKVLTLARDLKRRKARERQGLFVTEGVRAVEELARSSLSIRGALIAPQLEDAPRGRALRETLLARGTPLTEVDAREFASAAETESPQGVLAIAEVPAHSLDSLSSPHRLLVLDAVQDPGNVGTILRTAAAFGFAVAALPGTVDLWNAKVVRAAMGAHFALPAVSCTGDELAAFQRAHTVVFWGADAAGTPVDSIARADVPRDLAVVVGNEGNGLSADMRERVDRLVSIPIARDVESLNVAIATGILLFALRS